jgi:uncharacterized protein with von Willebrand factor type A (vWA) domain
MTDLEIQTEADKIVDRIGRIIPFADDRKQLAILHCEMVIEAESEYIETPYGIEQIRKYQSIINYLKTKV